MNKKLVPVVLSSLLAGCLSLPGSDSVVSDRYMLQGPDHSCQSGKASLNLSITRVSAGLDNNRVARLDMNTGEFTYLKSVNWVDESGAMLEQRLATDLECAGYAVITSHHRNLNHDQLICEVRAFNLLSSSAGDSAEVALSCLYFAAAATPARSLQYSADSNLQRWSASSAIAALSSAYQQVFSGLLAELDQAAE